MSEGPHISTPTAIMIGSLIVAVGVYLGLRSSQPPTPHEPAPAPIASAPVPVPAAPVVPVVPREVVARQATEALAYHRGLLMERCYRPLTRGAATSPTAKYIFDVSFDAAGSQVIRGIRELRGNEVPELTRCVNELLPALAVPPPGAPVMVEIPLEFP